MGKEDGRIAINIHPQLIERSESEPVVRVVAAMLHKPSATMSDVLRVAIDKGLAALEQEAQK